MEKSSLEKNEFIETSSIKFREMFFFLPSLFEINFSNISIQCENNNKSRKISAFFTLNWNLFKTNNRYNTKILTKSIEFSIKRRINKLIFNFASLLTICFVPFNTRGNGRASNLLELKLQKTLNPKIKIQNPDYHIFIPIFTPNPNHPN